MKYFLIALALLAIVPFYSVVWMWCDHDRERSVNPPYINELRRLSDPAFSLHAYTSSIEFQTAVGKRHLVINPPYSHALLLSAVIPALLLLSRILIMKSRTQPTAAEIGAVWTIFATALFVSFIVNVAYWAFTNKVIE